LHEIWNVVSQMLENGTTDFGRDPRSCNSLKEGAEIFFFCPVNNVRFRRFPVGQILHLNTTTSIGVAM